MKPILIGTLVAVVSLLSSVDAGFALSNNFTCGTGKISTCTCTGTKDCRGMRTSGMCSGPMTCDAKGCTCLVVGIAGAKHKPGGGVSTAGTAGMAPVNAPSKPRQSSPTRKFKPLLPIAGMK